MLRSLFILLVAMVVSVQAADLTTAQRAQVWTEVWSKIDQHFTGFDGVPEIKWQDSLQPVMKRLLAIPSEVDFWREVRAIVNKLNDGQTTVTIPPVLPRQYDTIPIRMMIAGDKVLVKRLSSAPLLSKSGIKVGDELVAVDGVPVFEFIMKNCMPHAYGSTRDGKLAQAVYRVLTGKADSDARLSMKRPKGDRYEVTIKRTSIEGGNYYSELSEPAGVMNEVIGKDILYYRLDSFMQWDFVNEIFSTMAANRKVKDLILDLRGNSTGPVPGDLLSRIAYFPLPLGAYKEITWKSVMADSAKDSLKFVREWKRVDGEMIEPADSVFRGRIVALIGPETAGPAERFLEPLVFAQRVTLIGDTTAGAGGTPASFMLPAEGKLFVTSRKPVWEKGYGVGKGFAPDLRVIPTAAGVAAGKDEVRAAAVDFLKKGKK